MATFGSDDWDEAACAGGRAGRSGDAREERCFCEGMPRAAGLCRRDAGTQPPHGAPNRPGEHPTAPGSPAPGNTLLLLGCFWPPAPFPRHQHTLPGAFVSPDAATPRVTHLPAGIPTEPCRGAFLARVIRAPCEEHRPQRRHWARKTPFSTETPCLGGPAAAGTRDPQPPAPTAAHTQGHPKTACRSPAAQPPSPSPRSSLRPSEASQPASLRRDPHPRRGVLLPLAAPSRRRDEAAGGRGGGGRCSPSLRARSARAAGGC